jgi:ABC-type transporter Mla MlaB component
MTSEGPPREPGTTVLVLRGPVDPSDVPDLCDRVRVMLMARRDDVLDCDVSGIADPDASTVDALARVQLTAGRLGRRVRFRGACGELEDLLRLTGLSEVLPCGPPSGLELVGEVEQREQDLRVEEEADPGDPIA